MLNDIIGLFTGPEFLTALRFLFIFYPVWLPLLLFVLFMQVWMKYIRTDFINKQGKTLLEFKLPREILKSPAAMEIFLNSLWQGGTGNWIDVYFNGKVRPWFSLELASIEGEVKFFLWTHPKFKNLIESQLYAQYPNVEIYEVPDYTAWVRHDPVNYTTFATQFELLKPDAYPIKTYIDYGLDRDPKEEFKIDPLASVLEYLGSLKAGEHAWIQILIRAHKKEGLSTGNFAKREEWKKAAKEEIKKIAKESAFKSEDPENEKLGPLSPGERSAIETIERNMSKAAFDTMIRGVYHAKKESFNATNIGGLIASVRQFNSNMLNGFKPGFGVDIDYFWQDFRNKRRLKRERELLDAYRRRSFFYPPYQYYHGRPFILTTEEIATMYHFPGQVAATPTLTRIPSKKAQPPANLPL